MFLLIDGVAVTAIQKVLVWGHCTVSFLRAVFGHRGNDYLFRTFFGFLRISGSFSKKSNDTERDVFSCIYFNNEAKGKIE